MSYKTKLAIVLVKIKYTSLTSSLQPTLPLAPNQLPHHSPPLVNLNFTRNSLSLISKITSALCWKWRKTIMLCELNFLKFMLGQPKFFTILSLNPGKECLTLTNVNAEQWTTLDSIVLLRIYYTISFDLLATVMEKDSTTMATQNRLVAIFQDNKNFRVIALEEDFSSTCMDGFSNLSAYCQQLKQISIQSVNLGALINNHCLVLQLVSGLSKP